jgi:formamidopyrimidine-DNA glycosylase
MTGFFKYFKKKEKEPEYSQIIFHFSDQTHLSYVSWRKLGTVQWLEAPEFLIEKKELGPDILKAAINFDNFRKRLEGKKGYLKSQLMNQQFLSGSGNIYSDEILYHCGFHPRSKIEALSEKQVRKLFEGIKRILKKSIEYKADVKKMPSTYLLPNRKKGKSCGKCGGTIQKIKVSGRSTYFCPKHQKRII